ncbi:hypothetical protein FACS1894152_0550 [Bacilli bacterium]|nr:hypothetical protein FACS1894152_0550 [Bacilli bacterium]
MTILNMNGIKFVKKLVNEINSLTTINYCRFKDIIPVMKHYVEKQIANIPIDQSMIIPFKYLIN